MARSIDGSPLEHHFDRGVGFAAYALLFTSSFFAGITGLVAAALAYSHRRDASPMMAGHYNFQIRLFWSGIVFFCLSVVAFVGAAALGIAEVMRFVPQAWLSSLGVNVSDESAGVIAWALLATAIGLLLASWAWTTFGALYGLIKLAGGRPIGQYANDDDI